MDHPGSADYDLIRRRLITTRKAQGLTLREVGERIGVSAATLSRFEKKQSKPDLGTVERLVDWLELDRAAVFNAPSETSTDTPRVVRAHLRADRNLEPRAAEALAESFDRLYQAFANDPAD
jgi:transcriptional regulator with XRE-family HTH domain